MILSIASHKGGVGKTTTAIHFAAYLQTLAPTLLLDGDTTKNALNWTTRGRDFPYKAAPVSQAAKLASQYAGGHIVIDTGQRPEGEVLRELAGACDLLIIPAKPTPMDTEGLMQTVRSLKEIGFTAFKVLLTCVPPPPERDAVVLRGLLEDAGVQVFKTEIPRLKAFEKAAGSGKIVGGVDDRNAQRAWEAYVAAGKELGL